MIGHKKTSLDSVPDYFKLLNKEKFNQLFLPDQKAVNDHIGPFATQNIFNNIQTLSHSQLTNWLGSYAMQFMLDSSYKYWYANDNKSFRDPWLRLMWQFTMTYPIGFIVANFSLKSNSNQIGSWNPAFQSKNDFSKAILNLSPSNRRLSALNISQAVHFKIFRQPTDSGLMFSLCDAFSNNPNPDNPLTSSLKRAIKKTIYHHPYPLPYFWLDAINQIMSSNELDLIELKESYSSAGLNPLDFDLSLIAKNKINANKIQTNPSSKIDAPQVTSSLTDHVSEPDIEQSPVAELNVKVDNSIDEEKGIVSPSELIQQEEFIKIPKSLSDRPVDYNQVSNLFFDTLHDCITNKVLIHNAKGASFHKIGGHIALVPGNYAKDIFLASPHLNSLCLSNQDVLHKALLFTKSITKLNARILPNRIPKAIDIDLYLINPVRLDLIKNYITSLTDNPDIQILQKK